MTESRRSIEERLYALLPAVHRIRDAAQGEPLRALLAILEHEFSAVRDDVQGLYDDWFVETCQEWTVPYLGDLLGVELMRSIAAEGFTQRGYVANTLRYRRRKGTAAVLEQLARDTTGWPARAVEYFERLATTQHLHHVRRAALASVSLRAAHRLELNDGPFGDECHTGEVRAISSGAGRFNIPNIGLHLWRLRAYPLTRVEARPLISAGVDPGRYHFDALGRRGPLWNDPRAETAIVHLAEERDVPAPLRRRALHAELRALGTGQALPEDGWFGVQPVLRVVRVDGGVETEIAPPQLRICNLEARPDDPATDWPRPDDAAHALCDPETGRLSIAAPAAGAIPDALLVDYSYAFSADLGGGPYSRSQTVPDRSDQPLAPPGTFQQGVSKDYAAVGSEVVYRTLSEAIDAWNLDAVSAWSERRSIERLIAVMDSRSYAERLTLAAGHCIVIPPNSRLRLIAARWPSEHDASLGREQRSEGRLDAAGVRPHIRGDLEVLGVADATNSLAGGTLELDGFLIEGSLTVLPGALGTLAVRHCTLAPASGGLRVWSTEMLPASAAPSPFDDTMLSALAANASLDLEITRCIVHAVQLTGSVGSVRIDDSIVDDGADYRVPDASSVDVNVLADSELARVLTALAQTRRDGDPTAINQVLARVPDVAFLWLVGERGLSVSAYNADVDIRTSTLLGELGARSLEGSESVFRERLAVRVVQSGCLRYCYATEDSLTPQRFRCQPDLALLAAETAARDTGEAFSEPEAAAVRGRVHPLFTSTTYGHHGYAQLARGAAHELTTGAEDGSEMGAFNMLKQAHRESNLRAALEQYLRFGLEAGLFFVT